MTAGPGIAQKEGGVPGLFQALWPLIHFFAGYNRLLPLSGIRKRYTHQIEQAGLQFDLSADEFLAMKEIAVLVMTAVGLLVYATLFQNLLVVAALGFAGLMLPDLRLSAAVKAAAGLSAGAAHFLDLLALAVEAGLGLTRQCGS